MMTFSLSRSAKPWIGCLLVVLRQLETPNLAAVAVANGVVLVTTSGVNKPGGGALHALNASDGSLLWKGELPTITGAAPSIADGMVFVGAGFGLPPAMLPDKDGALVAFRAD